MSIYSFGPLAHLDGLILHQLSLFDLGDLENLQKIQTQGKQPEQRRRKKTRVVPMVALSGDDKQLAFKQEFRISGNVDHKLDTL